MMTKSKTVDSDKAQQIIYKLLKNTSQDEFIFYTDDRSEYEILFDAANRGLFPEVLSITHRGLRLNKRLVHTPLSMAFH
jgi:hypothetical protein